MTMNVTQIRLFSSSAQSLCGEIHLAYTRTSAEEGKEGCRGKAVAGEKIKNENRKTQENAWSWKEKSCRQSYLAKICHKIITNVSWQVKSSVS